MFTSLFDNAIERKKREEAVSSEKNNNLGNLSKKNRRRKRPRPPQQPNRQLSADFPVKKQRPSKEALELSAKFKELSSQKRLDQALELYRGTDASLRDSHHACSVIDCAARCGAIEEGEAILEDLEENKQLVTVETYTALLKGYAHAGMMHKGSKLYFEKIQSHANVRSFNTLLRGCLWTAATVDDSGTFAAGIVTSSRAWKQSTTKDASSFEYYIAQLCQALRVEEAVQEIERLEHGLHHQTHRNDTAGDNTKDPSALETLSICLLALARAQALLGRKEDAHSSAQRVLHAVEMATQIIQKGGSSTASNSDQRQGGKRAWKSQQDDSRRARSNQLFRAHRLQEVRREAGDLLSCFESQQKQGNNTARSVQLKLGRQIATRLYYLAGGGTSPLRTQENVNTKDLLAQLMTCKWHSFGLQTVVSSLLPQFQPSSDILSRKECKKVLKCLDLQGIRLVNSEGFIPFVDLFDREVDTPLDIELGSGFGDWIVQQAKANPGRNYVAVELRADRIAQTFARAMLQPRPLDNLCCVGAECGSFLRDFVHKNTVSTIFVNHPEPPTQTYGADQAALIKISQGDKEPAHMLSSATIINAMECLESREGRLVIVTDNQMYARLIAASAQKAIKSKPNLIMPVNQVRSMLRVETFGTVTILQGQPGEVIRHSSSKGRGIGQSYFDRLWNTGAGAHSERSKRFIIVLARSSDSG